MLYTACPLSSMVGMPAFGLAMTGMDTFSLMLRTTDTSWSGPTEQLIPTASAPAASRETEASIALPPLKILPSASTVMVHMIGRSHTELAASTAARVSSMLIMVSAAIRSMPASARIRTCSWYISKASV